MIEYGKSSELIDWRYDIESIVRISGSVSDLRSVSISGRWVTVANDEGVDTVPRRTWMIEAMVAIEKE